jgi:hypothetical protein
MSQTGLALDPDALRSLAEVAPAQTAMNIRPILSHELLVGDYLGVISSMHQPEHFRRVRSSNTLTPTWAGPTSSTTSSTLRPPTWDQSSPGAMGSPGHSSCQRATSTSGSMSLKTGRPRTSRTGTGASSVAGMGRCSASLVSPTRPTSGSSAESRNSRHSGNATSGAVPISTLRVAAALASRRIDAEVEADGGARSSGDRD